MKTLIVEREKIIANLDIIKEASGGVPVMAVLKANAYGLGLKEMLGVVREEGIRRLAVTEPADAQCIRDLGANEEEILVLRSTACEEDVKAIINACATATIGSYDAAVALNGIAEREGVMVDAHIKIDTGMGRYGFAPGETERIISVYRYMQSINITGMYTHFSRAFNSKKKTRQQYEQLKDTAAKIRSAGLDPGVLHAANSAALLACDLPPLDMVRVGTAIGGRTTAKGEYGLQKTGRLESTVAEVKSLPKGHGVGYGGAYVTKQLTRIAIIPVGTYDGFMVEKSRDSYRLRDSLRYMLSDLAGGLRRKKFYVLVNGKKARVLGRVGLAHTTVDVSEIECSPGDRVVFDVQPMYVPESIPRKYI